LAPTAGGTLAGGSGGEIPVDRSFTSVASVLYDAVVVLTSKDGAAELAPQPAVRDFVADAYAHCKFVGYVDEAVPLFKAAGLPEPLDDGFVRLSNGASVDDFLVRCGQLRFWERQPA
jgi:catalase